MRRYVLVLFLLAAAGCAGFTAGTILTSQEVCGVKTLATSACREYGRERFVRALRAIDGLEDILNRPGPEETSPSPERSRDLRRSLGAIRERLLTAVIFFDYAALRKRFTVEELQGSLAPAINEASAKLTRLCRHFSETAAGEQLITLFRLPCPGLAPVVGKN